VVPGSAFQVPGSGSWFWFRFLVLVPVPGSGSWFRFRFLVPVPGSPVAPLSIDGVECAHADRMAGKRSPEEFDAWQLAWELKARIGRLTAINPVACDRKFCDEINEAARSAPDNIAEGFYRFNPADFANYVRIARGSLGEVRNQLKHAHSRGYVNDAEFAELFGLCRRAIGAATGLRLYLLGCPKNFDPRRPKSDSDPTADRTTLKPKPSEPSEPKI
jgi:four helix bundle protein